LFPKLFLDQFGAEAVRDRPNSPFRPRQAAATITASPTEQTPSLSTSR
jgi:hypothetical protein